MLERLSGWIVGSTELGGVSEPKSKCNRGNNGAHKSRSKMQQPQIKEQQPQIQEQQPQIRVIQPESAPTTQVTEDCLK